MAALTVLTNGYRAAIALPNPHLTSGRQNGFRPENRRKADTLRLICLASQTAGFALLADYIPNRQNPNNKCLKTYETYVNIVETKQIG